MTAPLLGIPLIGVDQLLTQQAAIERDQATANSFGARTGRDWQPLATVPCFMWWGTGAVITRMGSIQQQPERTVDLDTGGMVLPEGTDITARDRIANVLDENGDVIADGPFEILAVAEFAGITELSFRKLS